jgi:hypothetical protein
MTRIKRQNLKDRFRAGRMPTEGDFSDLIDSMVNVLDEGFEETPDAGLMVNQIGTGHLASFFENLTVNSPQWFLELGPHDPDERSFHISTPTDSGNATALSLVRRSDTDRGKRRGASIAVGVNKRAPRYELDVGGALRSHGRIGKAGSMPVPADGDWHDITKPLNGCNAFEIVAGVGSKEDSEGRYALLHATALNAFNGKGCIEQSQARFGSRCNRIELRWTKSDSGSPFSYTLQMRVKCAYEPGAWIRYHITQLWFDTLMEESLRPVDPEDSK